MKPELRIALVKESERTKNILSEEYSNRWTRMGYIGSALFSLFGVYMITSTISHIAKGMNIIFGAFYLLFCIAFTFAPWYFIIRRNINRSMKLICEAILAIDEKRENAG